MKTFRLAGHDNLKLDLEGNNQELSKLRLALQTTELERDTVIDETLALISKINKCDIIHDELKAQIEQVEREKSQLQLKINDLDLEFQAANNQLLHVKNAFVAAEEEKKAMLAENSIVQGKLQEVELRTESLQIAFGLLNEENSILRSKLAEADRDIYNLKFERDELLCDNMLLEDKAIELSIDKDVQLRLCNEQFKIAETERKKRQESFKRFVEGLQKLRLIGLGAFFNEFQEVKSVSFESMKHTKKQVAECLLELQDVKAFLELEWHLKRKHEKEKHELELKLRYHQGIIMDLKDEASRKVIELAQTEKQLKVLEMMFAESKRSLKEKEREVLDKDEEKREAIRQLCLLNEYHRENYNYLTRHVSSVLQSRRPS